MTDVRRLPSRPKTKAGWLFFGGLAVVAAWNWYRWQEDRALAMRLCKQKSEAVKLHTTPRVTALVAAWNEASNIREHIQSFLQLQYPNKELILCAGGDDGTYEIARQYVERNQVPAEDSVSGVVVLQQQPGEGKQRALRRCLERAVGEVIFLTDADCLFDDDSFSRTLASLLLDGEAAATGTSRPLQRQLGSPFIVYQWCTDIYVASQHGDYVPGMLGRNCAVTRQALEQIDGFNADVRTGTDYHMAKSLLRQGYRIRYVRDSAIESRYPATVRSYWGRQSRWVRNLIVHGPASGARDEVAMALRTTLVGLVMLLLPAAALLVGPVLLALWGVLFFQALLAKMRYARFARLSRRAPVTVRQLLWTPAYMLADFIAWSRPLVDMVLNPERW